MSGAGKLYGIGVWEERALENGECFAGGSGNPHARPGSEGTHRTVDILCGHSGRVYCATFSCELATESHSCQRLWDGTEMVFQCLNEELRAKLRQTFPKVFCGVLWSNRNLLLCEDRSRIESFDHTLDGDSCAQVSCEDGMFDGGGAAPSGEERSVEIHWGNAGEVKNVFGEDLAVGDDDEKLRIENGELRIKVR